MKSNSNFNKKFSNKQHQNYVLDLLCLSYIVQHKLDLISLSGWTALLNL